MTYLVPRTTGALLPIGFWLYLVGGSISALSFLAGRKIPAVARIFDGEKEAKLIALACSKPPKDASALDPVVVGEKVVGTPNCRSRETTSRLAGFLEKHPRTPSPSSASGVIPPKANSAFVADMEDVLAVDTRPRKVPITPLVCLDEDLQAVPCRDAPANPDEAGTPGPLRLPSTSAMAQPTFS